MSSESYLRIAMFVVMAHIVPVGFYHRLRAASSGWENESDSNGLRGCLSRSDFRT